MSAQRTCGDCGVDTKKRYLEILEFTHFVTFFSFNKICENHKEKILVKKVTVVVALDLDTGNTKNPDNESEQWTIRYIDRLQGYLNESVPIFYIRAFQ